MTAQSEHEENSVPEDRPSQGALWRLGWGWWMTGGVAAGLLISGIVFEYFLKYDRSNGIPVPS